LARLPLVPVLAGAAAAPPPPPPPPPSRRHPDEGRCSGGTSVPSGAHAPRRRIGRLPARRRGSCLGGHHRRRDIMGGGGDRGDDRCRHAAPGAPRGGGRGGPPARRGGGRPDGRGGGQRTRQCRRRGGSLSWRGYGGGTKWRGREGAPAQWVQTRVLPGTECMGQKGWNRPVKPHFFVHEVLPHFHLLVLVKHCEVKNKHECLLSVHMHTHSRRWPWRRLPPPASATAWAGRRRVGKSARGAIEGRC